MATTKITTNSLADSAVTSAKLSNSISIGTLAVTGDLTVDTNTLFVDAVNNRVGIGTAAPLDVLHVTHPTSSTIRTASGTRRITLNSFAGDWNYNTSFGAPYIIGTQDNNSFLIYSNNQERIRVSNGGNVGIGTTTPTEKLDVVGNVAVSGDITLPTISSGIILKSPDGPSYKLTVNNDGSLQTTAI